MTLIISGYDGDGDVRLVFGPIEHRDPKGWTLF